MTTAMNDDAFLAAFESGTLPREAFHHRDHVRLAWLCLGRHGLDGGSRRFIAELRGFADRHGASRLYHETVTRAWIRLVWAALAETPPGCGFDGFLARHPLLAEKDRLRAFYSPERLASEEARAGFVEPDRAPLPATPAAESVLGP